MYNQNSKRSQDMYNPYDYCRGDDKSTISKMKETYWTTKQMMIKKLGKKEDEHIVASDSELDAKLEVFKAIEQSSIDLLRIIERYQDRICILSREENSMSRLLKSESNHDKTRAGKMMVAVGKAQNFSSQQMLQLRAPLVRLYQEVETFRYRAITDTLITVNKMEIARNEYRGALLWMKNVSEELDPDTTKQLNKFRTVQAQVKKTKAKFDRLKLDTMQKIDLLAASRCNMFSHVLAKYQSALLQYWEKTANRMSSVAESFKGYQYYEFNMLKELGEPSKKLIEETGGNEYDDPEDCLDNDSNDKWNNSTLNSIPPIPKASGAAILSAKDLNDIKIDNLVDLTSTLIECEPLVPVTETQNNCKNIDTDSINNLMEDGRSQVERIIDFGEDDNDVDLDEILRKQDEEFNFNSMLHQTSNDNPQIEKNKSHNEQIIDEFLDDIVSTNQYSDLSREFNQEWDNAFGQTSPLHEPKSMENLDLLSNEMFMPSALLDLKANDSLMDLTEAKSEPVPTLKPVHAPPKKKDRKQELSSWFNLFAELDPLSNPDAIGRKQDDLSDA